MIVFEPMGTKPVYLLQKHTKYDNIYYVSRMT